MKYLLFSTIFFALLISRCSAQGQNCQKANLCFAIDESGSISSDDFITQANTINSIVGNFSALATGSSYSAAGFSSKASTILSPTNDVAAFQTAISGNPKAGGVTSSGAGLNECNSLSGSLDDPRIFILFTDGRDNVVPFGTSVAPTLKANGITIVTVGIGSGVEEDDLKDIASRDDLFVNVSDFDTLSTRINDIVTALCTAVGPPPSTTPSSSPSPSVSPTPSTSPSASASQTPSISPTPSTSTSPSTSPTPSPSMSSTPSVTPSSSISPTPSSSPSPAAKVCAIVNCVRCNSVLECYVNSGMRKVDKFACRKVKENKFCKWGMATMCNQSCRALRDGVKCFTGVEYGGCPHVNIGGMGGAICNSVGKMHRPVWRFLADETKPVVHSRGYGTGNRHRKKNKKNNNMHGKGGRRQGMRFGGGRKNRRVQSIASYKICKQLGKTTITCLKQRCHKGSCHCA